MLHQPRRRQMSGVCFFQAHHGSANNIGVGSGDRFLGRNDPNIIQNPRMLLIQT